MSKYSILLWDADDTLLDFDKSTVEALNKSFAGWGITVTDEMHRLYGEVNTFYWKKLERGEIEHNSLRYERFAEFLKRIGRPEIDCTAIAEAYHDALEETCIYMENSLEVCRSLAGECRQFIVTNGSQETQLKRLRMAGFDTIMEQVFISEEIGYNKPSKEFFAACFGRINDFKREEAIIIGDSLTSDMQGGNNAGITTCWYNPRKFTNTADVQIDYEISRLRQVKVIIQE